MQTNPLFSLVSIVLGIFSADEPRNLLKISKIFQKEKFNYIAGVDKPTKT